MSDAPPVFSLRHATVRFPRHNHWIAAVNDVSWSLWRGQATGLVGESGSGKSLSALAALDLVPPPGVLDSATIHFAERQLKADEVRNLRGRRVGLVLQEPATAFNPVFSIGFQLRETISALQGKSRSDSRQRAGELLREVELECDVAAAYPHQLSGGQLQRAMIAVALAGDPDVLIADEPTTALDLSVQARILELFRRLMTKRRLAMLIISHDLKVVASLAQHVTVMYMGQVVEEAPAATLLRNPIHPYTRLLLGALPAGSSTAEAAQGTPFADAAQPLGCRFAPRCPGVLATCTQLSPELQEVDADHRARCPVITGDGGADS